MLDVNQTFSRNDPIFIFRLLYRKEKQDKDKFTEIKK